MPSQMVSHSIIGKERQEKKEELTFRNSWFHNSGREIGREEMEKGERRRPEIETRETKIKL